MNFKGAMTLFMKEVRRFLKVPGQTLFSPLISTALYFVVFGYTIAGQRAQMGGVSYVQFIVPGLVFMGVATNAFANTSSSLFVLKLQGAIVDLLIAPLSPVDWLFAFAMGGVVRGVLVGFLTWLMASFFTGFHMAHPLLAIGNVLLTAYVFSVAGFLISLWAEKFEQVNFFPTFVMTPLMFLGGVFYSIDVLPPFFRTLSLFNPVVHMVDGLRAGILGFHVANMASGAALLLSLAVVLTLVALRLLKTGYKLRV